jgi:hypothetical protein
MKKIDAFIKIEGKLKFSISYSFEIIINDTLRSQPQVNHRRCVCFIRVLCLFNAHHWID